MRAALFAISGPPDRGMYTARSLVNMGSCTSGFAVSVAGVLRALRAPGMTQKNRRMR